MLRHFAPPPPFLENLYSSPHPPPPPPPPPTPPLIALSPQCPGCLGQAVVMFRLPCTIAESPRRHKCVPFVNITSPRSWSIKWRQWKHKVDYYGVVFAHLATRCGINAKDPSGWIQIGESCTQGVARIPLGLNPSHDSRAISQRDSPLVIQPFGVFRYKSLWGAAFG